MLFSTPIFLFVFLPIVLFGYLLVGNRLRNIFLFCASIIFYAWGEGRYVILLLLSIIINYIFGLLLAKYRESSKGKLLLWVALITNLGSLIWYKYAVFIAENINIPLGHFGFNPIQIESRHLPLGISFFTFQAIAYLLDVYREDKILQKSFTRFALFMALFPKMAVGPIIRHEEIAKELCNRRLSLEDFSYGVKRFVIGIGKKVIIADTIANTSDRIFAIPQHQLSTGVAWLGIICFTLQIYFDFSGYSDMAIGLSRMFGFKIQENFNYPYIAKSMTEFWRRWHISLSTWFRDYLFIPLTYLLMTDSIRKKIAQGKYETNYRVAISIFTVFALCGLWHGAGFNFIAWGMIHGLFLSLESLWLGKFLKRLWLPLQHVYLLLVVTLSWVLFRSAGIIAGLAYLKILFGFTGIQLIQYNTSLYLNNELLLVISVGILGSTPICKYINKFIKEKLYFKKADSIELALLLLILTVSIIYMTSSTYSPSLYQQF